MEERMKITIVMKGGASSIDGEIGAVALDELAKLLQNEKEKFIILDKTPMGKVVVNKSNIGYIARKQ